MSKSFYMQSKIRHALQKFVPTTQRIQVGNGQYVAVLFVMPVIIEIHSHLFEVFTLVSEIHDNVDLVLGMKNAYELEGIVDMQDSSFKFLNRSIPFFSKEQTVVKPKEKKFVKIEAPFIDEISGHAIVKMIDNDGRCTVVLKLKFVRNCAFVMPVIIEIHRHLFEAFTLVSEIHDNVDLVLGMKNAYELEGIVDMRDSSFKFLNRSIPFSSKEQTVVKPKEKKFVKIEAPFIDEISGHAIVKMIDNDGRCTVVLKLKFVRNCASLDVVNNTQETAIFNPNQILGILDLRSLSYYKIKQGVWQQNLSKNYHFESVEKLCKEFNAIINERNKQEEKEVEKDKYPWLDDSDERKYMTDREILEKYINLDNSCLTESENVQVRDMICKYREAVSLRDEIGTYPNIEIDIDVMDKTPFFIRPYQVREEDKRVLDKEMKRFCYLGILKEGFSAYSSPVMLVSRKLTQDKRVVTNFRHLNTRIAKNNLAYPLVKDTFTTLGNSKCEVLSVLDLKI